MEPGDPCRHQSKVGMTTNPRNLKQVEQDRSLLRFVFVTIPSGLLVLTLLHWAQFWSSWLTFIAMMVTVLVLIVAASWSVKGKGGYTVLGLGATLVALAVWAATTRVPRLIEPRPRIFAASHSVEINGVKLSETRESVEQRLGPPVEKAPGESWARYSKGIRVSYSASDEVVAVEGEQLGSDNFHLLRKGDPAQLAHSVLEQLPTLSKNQYRVGDGGRLRVEFDSSTPGRVGSFSLISGENEWPLPLEHRVTVDGVEVGMTEAQVEKVWGPPLFQLSVENVRLHERGGIVRFVQGRVVGVSGKQILEDGKPLVLALNPTPDLEFAELLHPIQVKFDKDGEIRAASGDLIDTGEESLVPHQTQEVLSLELLYRKALNETERRSLGTQTPDLEEKWLHRRKDLITVSSVPVHCGVGLLNFTDPPDHRRFSSTDKMGKSSSVKFGHRSVHYTERMDGSTMIFFCDGKKTYIVSAPEPLLSEVARGVEDAVTSEIDGRKPVESSIP